MPIIQEGGRWRSVRTSEERTQSAVQAVAGLSQKERLALHKILQQMGMNGHSILAQEVAEVEWEEQPLPIAEWLMSEDHVGETGRDMYPQLRADMVELFEGNYHEAIFCLHPDTRVPLLDGTTPTIAELATRWEADPSPFWVYSRVNGVIRPMTAIQPRQTGVDDYYRVILDDGTTFTGNARHQMVMRDGSKRMIRDLKRGDSLTPFEVRFSDKGSRIGYEQVLDLDGRWRFTHQIVARLLCEKADGDEDTVHHEDFRKTNNTPENLRWMRWADHRLLHAEMYSAWRAANPEAAAKKDAKHAEHFQGLWDADDGARREEYAERLRRRNLAGHGAAAGRVAWARRSEESKLAFKQRMARRNKAVATDQRTDVTLDAVLACGATTIRQAARDLRCSPSRIRKVVTDAGKILREVFGCSYRRGRKNKFVKGIRAGPKAKITAADIAAAVADGSASTRAAAAKLGVSKKTIYNTLRREGKMWADVCATDDNHYVVSVERVGRGPVYCMTVPGAGNFAIATDPKDLGSKEVSNRSGVFSSNTGAIRLGGEKTTWQRLVSFVYCMNCAA